MEGELSPRAPVTAQVLDRLLTTEEALAIAGWAYEPPFDFYNLSGPEAAAVLTTRDDAGYGYYPVRAVGEVVGFLCFGAEARVQGQTDDPGVCDIGAGVRPDKVSQGLATAMVPAAVEFAEATFGVRRLRAAVAAFNQRSLRLCTSAGFVAVREFDGPRQQRFVELVLERTSASPA